MDKNMISIDDLVRDRLSGGEQKERPGAWLQMKDLLDKEMPVSKVLPAAGGNGANRALKYAAALLLLAGVSFGGYEMASKFKNNTTPATNNNNLNNATDTHTTASNNTIVAKPASTAPAVTTTTEMKSAAATTNNNNNSNRNTNKITVANASKQSENQQNTANRNAKNNIVGTQGNKAVKTTTNNNNSVAANNTTGNKPTIQNSNTKPAEVDNYSGRNAQDNKPVANNNAKDSKNIFAAAINNNKTQQLAAATEPKAPAQTANKSVVPSRTEKAAKGNIVPASNVAANKPANTTPNKNTADKKAEFFKDSINKIEVKQRYSRNGVITDTISVGKIEKDNTGIIADMPVAAAMSKKSMQTVEDVIIPNSASAVSKEEAAAERAKSSSGKGSGVNTGRLEEMVRNAKLNFSKVTFQPGVLAGINSSMAGHNSTFGLQAGLSGIVTFSDHWSVLGELKYFNQFNLGGQVRETYHKYDFTKTATTNTYVHDSVDHYYEYTTLSSLQLPIALRYSIQKISIMAGGNFSYNLAVNSATDLGKTYSKTETIASGTVSYKWENGAPQISIKDFSSRFSIGYLFGVAWQMAPTMILDARVTQSFWDNAKTPGQKLVSKALYDNPSVQLNFTYRIGKPKNSTVR